MKRTLAVFFAGIAVAYVVVWAVPAQAVCGAASPVISWASLNGHCVAENALTWAAALLAVTLLALWKSVPTSDSGRTAVPHNTYVGTDFLLVAIGVSVFAAAQGGIAAPLTDTFHEGEALAFGPAFERAMPFANSVLVHGFGTDVLPDLLARRFMPGAVIAGMRFFRMLEAIPFFAGLIWSFYELFSFDDSRRRRGMIVVVAILVPLLGLAGFAQELVRKSVLMLQFALLVRAVRTGRGWALLGASLPAGLFYNYAEGGAALLICGATLALRRRTKPALVVAAGGAAAGLVALIAIGPAQVFELARQVAYWGRTGGPAWMKPITDDPVAALALFAPLVATQALALAHLARRRDPEVWLPLLLSLSAFRCWTDRADDIHLAVAGVPTLLLIGVLLLEHAPEFRAAWAIPAAALLVTPAAAWKVINAAVDARTPDAKLVAPAYRAAAAEFAPEVGDCVFTLTSEGIWYHLFDKPSCSRFHHVVYARTQEAEAEVVAALETRRPPLVLVHNDFWSNHIDGVPVPVTNPGLYAYVRAHYAPYKSVGGNAFWKRNGLNRAAR